MQILPKEMIDVSIEPYLNRVRAKSQIIFITIIVAILGAIAALPMVFVDVNISGSGIIRPDVQRAEIYAPVSGRIENLLVKDNQKVIKGQVILKVVPDLLLQKEKFVIERIDQTLAQIQDLNKFLLFVNKPELNAAAPSFLSPFYSTSFVSFLKVMKKLDLNIIAERTRFNRSKTLFEQMVISQSEFEEVENGFSALLSEREVEIQSQLSKREGEKFKLIEQRDQLQADLDEIKKEKARYIIKAPVDGTIINLMKVHDGSFLATSQLIGEISPSTEMIAECYISPSDIGLLHTGQQVRFTVDAFNYNEWGFLDADIIEIAQDINFSSDDSKPYFVVKCKLRKAFLSLSNGQQGHLKKGMTLQGRFLVARRSLYQLLFDKTDDWINPSNR